MRAISSQADEVARRLAEHGYVAQAVSYGERTSGRILTDQDGTNRIKHVISELLTDLRHQPKVAGRCSAVTRSSGHKAIGSSKQKQWKYSPTLLNGKPVPVIATVTVDFNLK